MEQIDVGGLRIAYERRGHGPPLVLLHGYVGSGSGTWGPQLDELSDEFTVIAWDGPGAGGSSDPPETFTLADFADCLANFIRALSIGRPHVAGLSFGGGLAIELYHRHPDVPRSLVLASAYAGWAGSLPADEVARRLRQVLELGDLSPDRFASVVSPTLFSEGTPRETVDRFAAGVADFHPAGLRAMARSFAEADLRDVLPSIDVPTLLLFGEKDVRAPLDVARGLLAAIPHAKLEIFEGAGHIVNLERPQAFDAAVRAFLRSVEGR